MGEFLSQFVRYFCLYARFVQARIAIQPDRADRIFKSTDETTEAARMKLFTDAITRAGGSITDLEKANALFWLDNADAMTLAELLRTHPNIKWVQLPWAGVETFASTAIFDSPQTFTCAKGCYGIQVGEHALNLILMCLKKSIPQAKTQEWMPVQPDSLAGRKVTIIGAGGICENLIRYLRVAECDVTVLRRNASRKMENVSQTLSIEKLHAVLPTTEVLVLALSLTKDSVGIIGETELGLLPKGAAIVNVARGKHVNTAALAKALASGHIASAGLDVTDPEPLPADHDLWSMNNVIITSHSADSDQFVAEQLAARLHENLIRFQNGSELVGVVNASAGY